MKRANSPPPAGHRGVLGALWLLLFGFLASYAPLSLATDRVVLQLRWDHQFQFAGYYAARWKGFYREVGLDVEFRSAITPDGTILSATEEVSEGHADFGVGAGDILLARDQGKPLVMLASLFQQSAVEFYARPNTIQSFPVDLTHLKVVRRRADDLVDVEFRALLVAEGIDPALITPYPLELGRGYLSSLAEGKVDLIPGYSIGTPYEAERIGLDIVRFRPSAYGINFYGDSLFTDQRVIDRDPELVERFLAASLRGWRYALEYPEEIADRIVREFQPRFPIADFAGFVHFQTEEVRKLALFPIVSPGHINPDRWRHMHTLLKNAGLVTGDLDLGAFIFNPERWTEEHHRRLEKILGFGLGFVVLMTIGFFIWSWTLRRTVASRTIALRASQQTLRKNEERLRAIANYTYDWESWFSPEGRLLWVNPGVERQTGYSVEECLAMVDYPLSMVHPDDRDEMVRQLREAAAGSTANDVEFRIIRKDRHRGWAAASWQSIYDSRRNPLGFRVSMRDITERKRAEEALKHILDSMPSILVGVDPEGRVTEWSQGAEQRTGITAAEAQGCSLATLFPQFDGLLDRTSKAINDRQAVPTERWSTEKYEKMRYSDITIYPLLVAEEAVGAVIRIDDVTDRVRLEQMLLQTEKMLSVGGLAAGMAHELNNPLGIVLQSSQTILRRLSPDSIKNQRMAEQAGVKLAQVRAYLEQSRILSFLENVRDAAQRATQIVKEMMAFSGRGDTEFALAHLEEMLDAAVRFADDDYDLREQYHFRQLKIVRDYAATPGLVKCDRTGIEQVFLNVIKNAAQAVGSLDNGASPHSIALRTRQEGGWACVEIIDDGPGMDEQTRRRLFEPFFTTKPTGIGTGLGLSIAYFIVTEQHGGNISVSSALGQGTCITIRLPLATAKSAAFSVV